MVSFHSTLLAIACTISSITGVAVDDVQAFRVTFDNDDFENLKSRLKSTRFPHQLSDVDSINWNYGIPVQIMERLVNYASTDFNWSAQVDKMNTIPQFTAAIDDHTVHFIHQRSSNENAKPLMLVHGWPGSFWECHKILPILTEPQNFGGSADNAFHVVCPSIPGFAYSSKPHRKGFDQMKTAIVFSELMTVLGYEKYFLQGGDWGSVVTSFQASLPESRERVLGLHLNMVPAPPPIKKGILALCGLLASAVMPWLFYSSDEREALLQMPLAVMTHTGYFHEQSTQPQTLAYGLSDSPTGLLAWITEKFYVWGDCPDGDLFSKFSEDDLLTNFMIYWTTNSAGKTSVNRKCVTYINSGDVLIVY